MEFIEKLRKLADWLEAHPGLPEPTLARVDLWAWNKKDFTTYARLMGSATKQITDYHFMLKTSAEESGIPVELTIRREEICERVPVEVEVPEQIIHARAEEIIPAHVETKYEWRCPESILAE